MSVLVNKSTKVIIQGLGSAGKFHAAQMLQYGTALVGGIRPGKGGEPIDGLPVPTFDSVAEIGRSSARRG